VSAAAAADRAADNTAALAADKAAAPAAARYCSSPSQPPSQFYRVASVWTLIVRTTFLIASATTFVTHVQTLRVLVKLLSNVEDHVRMLYVVLVTGSLDAPVRFRKIICTRNVLVQRARAPCTIVLAS